MASEIENLFLEIENLIKLQLQDNVQNKPEVKKKFREAKNLIDDLEEEVNVEQSGLLKYKYHTKYASYLKAVHEIDNASRQENLAKNYEKYAKKSEKIDSYKTDSILFVGATLGDINQDSNPKENCIQEIIENLLETIQDLLEDKVIEEIRQSFKQLINGEIKSFDDYRNVIICNINLLKIMGNVIDVGLITLEELQTSNTNEIEEQPEGGSKIKKIEQLQRLISFSVDIRLLASKAEAVYEKRITFIRNVLNSPHKKDILYSNIIFTKEEIIKRFRELALYFHPDKMIDTPNQLQDKDKYLGAELFRYIQEFKVGLLADLERHSKNEGTLNFHEDKGHELWKIAIDYCNATKGQWDKLKLLKKEDIGDEDLNRSSETYGILACQEYRAACKIADNAKLLQKQVKLRGNIALCLYVSNKFLEAQLYALSAVLLLYQNCQYVTQDLIEARKIFDKVKGPRLNTEIKLEDNLDNLDNSDNTLALVKVMNREISYFEKNAMSCSIHNDIAKVSTELISKPDRSLVRYQASSEEILHAKTHAIKHKVAGGVIMVTGAGGGLFSGIALFTAGVLGGPLAFGVALGITALGTCSGAMLFKKGVLLLKEPETRKNLNEIISKALSAYDKGEDQKFLDALSVEYTKDVSLLNLKEGDNVINRNDVIVIINKLLSHGFRSDGIAYLLNLLGEVLIGGKIKIEGTTTKELKISAMNFFDAVSHENLIAEAKKLDERIRELRKRSYKSYVKNSFNKIKNRFSFKEYSDIAQDHINDAQKMPIQSRLEEMRNIARINFAILMILDTDPEEIERAKKIIKEVRNSITHNYQFVSTEKSRLEVLEDLLWVIGDEELHEDSPEELPKGLIKVIQDD